MKKTFIAASLLFALTACNNPKKEEAEINLQDETAKISYSLGVIYSEDLTNAKQFLDTIDNAAFIAGIKDAMESKSKIDVQTANDNIQAFMKAKQDVKVNENIEKGNQFFKQNAQKEGIVELENGMQYEVLVEGKGAKPSPTDRVKVHYHGTLLDGTVFDSSVDRGEPISFGLNEVIPGWTEILQIMPVGSKWRVYIPFNLAYGAQGSGPIGPYETLVFEMELLNIEK